MFAAESPAKLNLTLAVGPLRPDGFHPLESLVAHIGLHDQLTLTPHARADWTLGCSDATIPIDSSNLVLKAIAALRRHVPGPHPGGHIELIKHIPAGGGLGGGSSNAATTLRLLNQYWQLRLPDSELARIGATIGSDVPLFLSAPISVMRGRGERLAPHATQSRHWAALIFPPCACPTGPVYAAFDRLPSPTPHAAIESLLPALSGPADELMSCLFNDLEPAAFAVTPPLKTVFAALDALAPGRVRMTGSGSTLFRLFDERNAAQSFCDQAARLGWDKSVVARLGDSTPARHDS